MSAAPFQKLPAMHEQEKTSACEHERQQSQRKFHGLRRSLVSRLVDRAVHEGRRPRCRDQHDADETGR